MGADHRAFLDATLPHLDVVYQVARHAARDGQDPDDLVQETYLRAVLLQRPVPAQPDG